MYLINKLKNLNERKQWGKKVFPILIATENNLLSHRNEEASDSLKQGNYYAQLHTLYALIYFSGSRCIQIPLKIVKFYRSALCSKIRLMVGVFFYFFGEVWGCLLQAQERSQFLF